MNRNAVGIDVSKGKSMAAILRPYGEIVSSPFEIKHTSGNIQSLIQQIKSIEGESRIVMEHTGHYYEPLARELSLAGLFVTAINPKLIKDFGDNSLRKVKSDKADAVKIARYTLDSWTELKQYSLMDEIRNQLKTMNRQFGFYMKHKTAMKNNLIGILDQTYPGVNTYFDSPAREDGSQKWVDFAAAYWHVDCVRKMSLNAFVDHYQKWCKRKKYNFSRDKAEEIYGAARELIPVLPKDDLTKLIVKQAIELAQQEVPGVKGHYVITGDRPYVEKDDGSLLLGHLKQACDEVTGMDTAIGAFNGYTDTAVIAGTLGNHDCMSYGPGSLELAHKPNEYVPYEDVCRCRRVLWRLVERTVF